MDEKILDMRRRIDLIDDSLISTLEERLGIVNELMKYKIQQNLPIEDVEREREIINKYKGRINPDLAYALFTIIFEESKRGFSGR
ncbi:chorismate mutase [Candidatus Pacearchaeota archaeon]|nr:chorismate mutase [Candidatus Pacearchaeota archaeon]